MRKLGLGVIALLVIGALYYFTTGSTQLTQDIKQELNTQLVSIQNEGFSVQNRETKEKSEHFILSFDDPRKIAQFLSRQGLQMNVNDAELFKGLQVGVDVHYLPDTYASVSLDMYPVTLPTLMTSSITNEEEKKALDQITKMLDKKTFLMHISLNKLGNAFKGHMKDIDEILHVDKDLKLRMQGMTFAGDIKADTIEHFKQNLKELIIHIPDELSMAFNGLESDYLVTGKTPYDYKTEYLVKKIDIHANQEFDFSADNLLIKSLSEVKDGLADGTMTTTADHLTIHTESEKYTLTTLHFDVNASNLDVRAFEELQQLNVYDDKAVNTALQTLISKGIQFGIPLFSVQNIEENGKTMDGFKLNGHFNIDKSLDIAAMDTNPMLALTSVDANLNISISHDLYHIIAQQPQAMMALMIFQPKDVKGQKVYELELKNGKFTVNGMSMM